MQTLLTAPCNISFEQTETGVNLSDCAGDPALQGLQTQDMSWTISCDQETVVTAFSVPGSPPGRAWFGYALQEADRQASSSLMVNQYIHFSVIALRSAGSIMTTYS